jgi:hypothetical protein
LRNFRAVSVMRLGRVPGNQASMAMMGVCVELMPSL